MAEVFVTPDLKCLSKVTYQNIGMDIEEDKRRSNSSELPDGDDTTNLFDSSSMIYQ